MRCKMSPAARIQVDFNEMLEPNLVLLSQTDTRTSSDGQLVSLIAGLEVHLYEKDIDGNGRPLDLIADGIVEKNQNISGWSSAAIWCCRIDLNCIRHESN